jgi:hypothetical protein
MLGAEFRGLAEAVTRSYGDDPWFFLRELAQNSRDAGARSIRVSALSEAGTETLAFVDDGSGMTLDHARRFFFRLYASNKGQDPAAAGRYGIGFWTVLRFRPTAIRIESRSNSDSWAVALDADLNARPLPCTLDRHGTAISLSRPAAASSAEGFAAELERALLAYCRYLRRNDRKGTMLPLWFAGRNLVEPMALPGPLSLSFRSGPVEGAVGLGKKPLVRLYARGLPVWEGALLSQMSHLQADDELNVEVASGLAPVFLLNGNHLDVTFSRNLAVENRELDRVRKKAEKALHRLLATSLEAAFPRKWHQRWGDRLLAVGARLRHPGWLWLPIALLLLIMLEFVLLRQWFPARSEAGAASWFSVRHTPLSYRGAMVDAATAAAAPSFSYRPEEPSWFRLFTADAYDNAIGFVRHAGNARLQALPPVPCPSGETMSMRLQAEGGETFLPLAPGHSLIPGSLRLNGRPLGTSFATDLGEAFADLPAAGSLEYRSCPGGRVDKLGAGEYSRFTGLPAGTTLPAALEAAVSGSRSLPTRERLEQALALVRKSLVYDASPQAVESYRQLGSKGTWPARVLAIGRGDCDVLNGLLVLLLRRMDVPARLVVGMVGERGSVRPVLHAWCEYFDRGWAVSDATVFKTGSGPLPVPKNTPASAPAIRSRSRHPSLRAGPFLLFSLILLALSGLYLFIGKLRKKPSGSWASPGDVTVPLMQIVQHALLQPAAWGVGSPLWRHRILPRLGGDAVALEQAWRLQRRNRLFVTVNRNPLAVSMAQAGITVLDLGLPLYAPLRTLLPGAIDADRLCRLRPERPAANGLLASVNAIGRRSLRKPPPFLFAPGLEGSDMLHVSLPASLSPSPFYFPRRFIAIHPGAKLLAQCTELYSRNQALAVLRFLHGMGNGRLPDPPFSPGFLRRSARLLLRSPNG